MNKYIPYDFQQDAIDSIFTFFQTSKGNPLIVAPTGSGKSIIIACFCQQVIEKWPKQNILIISHIQTILEQNHIAIKKQCSDLCKIAVYSAGLKSKQIQQITIAGIQSIYDKPELFERFNLILIDECHLIPPGKLGRYHQLFQHLQRPIIGFTATPFRLGSGYLHKHKEALFADIAYTITISELQKRGFLCRLATKGTIEKLDSRDIKKTGGDYNIGALSLKFDRKEITRRIVQELLHYKDYRKQWLIFGIDITHVEHIAEELNRQGIKTASVHSKKTAQLHQTINDFKQRKYQALVSVAMLTTGFNVPTVDLIALLRPTSSPTLHVQIIGRGLRIASNKEDCLILDFAGNTIRNGDINDPTIRIKGNGNNDPIMKQCEQCFEIVHSAVKICSKCGYTFKFQHHLTEKPQIVDDPINNAWKKVQKVTYHLHIAKKTRTPTLLVKYMAEYILYKEYICLEHFGYAQQKAQRWWSQRCEKAIIPQTIAEALELTDLLYKPKQILIFTDQYSTIIDYKF